MTPVELAQLAALKECRFSPGSTAKAFIKKLRDERKDYVLSEKQAAFLDTLAHQHIFTRGETEGAAYAQMLEHLLAGRGFFPGT